jgi:hypothetical protein
MSLNTPNSFQDDINRLVNAFLNRVEQLKMRVIFGVQVVRGVNGKELEFRSDGKLYYNDVEVGTGSGIWTDTGTVAKLSTARDIDLQGERVYLKNTGTDSTSVYYEVDTVNSKVKWHVPSGYSFDYTVG